MLVHGRLEIQDSVFDNNVATDPPGTPNQKGHPGHPPPKGKGEQGLGHTGTHHGGAVMNIEGHVVARNSSFLNGNAYQGGALYTCESSFSRQLQHWSQRTLICPAIDRDVGEH
jgi:hypothetical protein